MQMKRVIQNFLIIGGENMVKYRIGIIICYIILGVVAIIDIVLRLHGMLALPVSIAVAGISLFLASKIAKIKAEQGIINARKEEIDRAEAENTLVDSTQNETEED